MIASVPLRRLGPPLALLVTALFVAGCTGPTINQPGSGAGAAIHMKNAAFDPPSLQVDVGTTVTWTNQDPIQHTVTPTDKVLWGTTGSGDEPAKWLAQGKSWSFTFTKAGVYEFYCIPHASGDGHGHFSGMVGTVRVGAAAVDVPDKVVPNPVAAPPTGRTAPARVALTLTTEEKVAQLADGAAYEFWTFGGTVPGPMLRVREGDTVDFTLTNSPTSKHPHSIDLHAVTGPGGGGKVTQTDPGKSTKFSFEALNPGVYVYHCATPHVPSHIANGMYGMILVEPKTPLPPVDHEYYVMQGEVYTEAAHGTPGLQTLSTAKLDDEKPEYVLMNGRVGALTGSGALQAKVGETVRIYFGVGGFIPSNFHLIGEIFDTVYPEAALGDPIHNVQTTWVPAGGATVVEVKFQVPGDYTLVDHSLTRAIDRGGAGMIHVEGTASDPAVFQSGT